MWCGIIRMASFGRMCFGLVVMVWFGLVGYGLERYGMV